jgi:hypothetical protein
MSLRAALAVFDDDALAGLANKGLLRRAGKAVETGKAEIVAEDGEAARVSVEGETVEITAKGPAAARCSCPARTVCQHILAAVLLLRGEAASDAPAADPLAEALALDPALLRKWAGVGAMRAATELAGEVETTVVGAALAITVGGLPEVRWLAGQGLDGVICKSPDAKRKTHVAAALLSLWRKHGVVLPEEAPASAAATPGETAPARIDSAFLAEVRKTLEDAASTALATAPQTLEERLFALSVSGRADALPRLSAMLRSLSRLIERARQHHVDSDEEELLTAIASAYALALALERNPGDVALRGEVRRKYEAVGALSLIGFGAHAWRTQIDVRGVTGFFFDTGSRTWRTVSLSRTGPSDTQFEPETTFTSQAIWHAGPLSTLARSRLAVTDAQAAEDRLSLSQETRVVATHAAYDFGTETDLPDSFADWSALHARLAERDGRPLTGGFPGREPVLLEPVLTAKPFFDDAAQEAVWPVADAAGRWLALVVSANEDGARRLDAIEYQLKTVRPRYVLATSSAEARAWRFAPYALLVEREGRLHLVNLDFDNLRGVAHRGWWWERLNQPKAKPIHGFDGEVRFARTLQTGMTDRLLADALDAGIAAAQMGAWVGEENTTAVRQIAQQLEAGGLGLVADLLSPLARSGPVNAKPLLALSYVLAQAIRQRRAMPYLHCSASP